MKQQLTFILLLFVQNVIFSQKNIIAHSHNDYEQKKPLNSAIQLGFNSIEIDIIRDGEKLRVTHDSVNLSTKPTIEELYFNPLKKRIKTTDRKLWLLVDLKYYDEKTLELLHESVSQKEKLFQKRTDTKVTKPLQIILSGDIPRKMIIQNKEFNYFFIDGRPEDLREFYDPHLMPLISTSFSYYSTFKGKGEIKEEELKKLNQLIRDVHMQNKNIRFWNTADNKKMWRFLNQLGVNAIGVDHLKKYYKFSRKNN